MPGRIAEVQSCKEMDSVCKKTQEVARHCCLHFTCDWAASFMKEGQPIIPSSRCFRHSIIHFLRIPLSSACTDSLTYGGGFSRSFLIEQAHYLTFETNPPLSTFCSRSSQALSLDHTRSFKS